MGKAGGSSWFTAVKRAFRSPTKENDKRRSSRRREEHEQEEEEKKRGKRRWIFRNPFSQETLMTQHHEERTITTMADVVTATSSEAIIEAEQRHAIAVAMAITTAAEAAVATAQAAVDVARLAKPSIFATEHHAAIVIQTAFRGYLARRALGALKGLVKLQALVRGHNVRKRAKLTLECMEALVRVQTRVCQHRANRLSHEPNTDSRYESGTEDEDVLWMKWDERPQTAHNIRAVLQRTKEAVLKRETALADAFSHQMWRRSSREACVSEGEVEDRESDRWRRRHRENRGRFSCDQREPIKIVEIDTYRPYSKPHHMNNPLRLSLSSPGYKTKTYQDVSSMAMPMTPPPTKMKHGELQMHSASPRCAKSNLLTPNYMAPTASAKARSRSQSVPRHRNNFTREKDKTGSLKKRLSFSVPDSCDGDANGGSVLS